jgi:hypothetical protein
MDKPEDIFEKFERETPEPKLELIEGQLIIGNSLAGSRYYLRDVLTGWGTQAALPFANPEVWKSALLEGFSLFSPPQVAAPLGDWQGWANAIEFEPRLEPAGPMTTGPHYWSRERMEFGISRACQLGGFGSTMGHDFVMRLGNNGFTPDGLLIGRQATERLCQRHLNGPADLVWEILIPGHEGQDRDVKRRYFEAGGVPHYWVVDPVTQSIDFWHSIQGKYNRETPDWDGRYRPASVPGLVFLPELLWKESSSRDVNICEVEQQLPREWSYEAQDGIDWDDVSFEPSPQLEAGIVAFDEFASWCPRAKFEGDGERTIIGGRLGTRNVLGMLIRTFGLIETVRLLHPRDWISGLDQVLHAQQTDSERKAQWWNLARLAAARLRSKYKIGRVAVIGCLTRPEPLHFWSELLLVVWDLPGGTFENYELIRDLDTDQVIDLIRPEGATGSEQRMIAKEAINIQ